MNNRSLVALSIFVFVLISLASGSAVAQQPAKIPQIGYLTAGRLSAIPERTEAFREGLRELGYIDGKNIFIEWRSAEGKANRAATLAAELVRLKVDVIVTGGESATRAAKKATSTVPIVMVQDRDPVGNGFVASLARPGGNITGLSRLYPELSGKRLELLKEIVPRLSRVAIFVTSRSSSYEQTRREDELAAERLGIKLQYLDVQGPEDLESVFREAVKGRADAILMQVDGPIINFQSKKIAELAIKSRLPVMHSRRYVEAGGLISYGESITDLDRWAATYVDKILKGAKPADLPVEQPTKFELVINLKTARALGLKIPPELLMEADKVIE